MTLWDVLRIYDVAAWAVITGLSLRALLLYLVAYRHSHAAAERRREAGVVPRYVFLMAASFIVLSGVAVMRNIERIGEPPSLHLPLNAFGFTLGIAGLWTIMRYERRRVRTLDGLRPSATQDSARSPRA